MIPNFNSAGPGAASGQEQSLTSQVVSDRRSGRGGGLIASLLGRYLAEGEAVQEGGLVGRMGAPGPARGRAAFDANSYTQSLIEEYMGGRAP